MYPEPERGRAVVVLPEFVPARWWQNLLHNQTALLLKAELLFRKSPNGDNRIVAIVNNYASMSFNFGPTLLSWLEEKQPEVYRAILDADAKSRERFGGHGSALEPGRKQLVRYRFFPEEI